MADLGPTQSADLERALTVAEKHIVRADRLESVARDLAEALKNLRFRALTNALVAGDIDKADAALAAWHRTHSDGDGRDG